MDEMMDQNIFDKVKHVDLKKTMETSYIDYAMSVIASRALPDVRDGLKPVQRQYLHWGGSLCLFPKENGGFPVYLGGALRKQRD